MGRCSIKGDKVNHKLDEKIEQIKTQAIMRPSIDHGLLSPSGHMSKRARKFYQDRTAKELFGEKGIPAPSAIQPTEKERLLYWAKEYKKLADSGMSSRKYRKLADECERKAKEIN